MQTRFILLALALLAFGVSSPATAQSVTAFKSGERTTNMTKQCFYDAMGSTYVRTIGSIALCPLSIQVQISPNSPSAPRQTPSLPATVMAFKRGEYTTGMTKQCFYEALGNLYTRTVISIELCPLSIQVRPGNP